MIKRYIKPKIGHVQLQKLNPLVVQDFVNGLKISPSSGKPMAAATIKHTFQLLRTAIEKAVLVGLIDRNPCIGVMLPKGQKKAAVNYDEEQIKRLIAAAKGTAFSRSPPRPSQKASSSTGRIRLPPAATL